ncbi:MAG: hypothetical protein AAGK17_01055 [Pseudomonadota bacterium]
MRDEDHGAPTPPRPDPKTEDIMAGDRRLSRPDSSLPDWEMPDAAYRPVPIVWFTGAFFLHFIVSSAILMILANQPAWAPIGLSALAGGAVFKWTWDRGMSAARFGWRLATTIMLVINVLYVAAAALSA